MTADILTFPPRAVSNRLQQALQGAMHAAWQTYCGDAVDIESLARLQHALAGQAVGKREARNVLGQIAAAQTWLEVARRRACERASEDGEYVSETADAYARLAVDLTGALGLLALCTDLLQPPLAVDMDAAWLGLELLEGLSA
jgi:hypothetical protein